MFTLELKFKDNYGKEYEKFYCTNRVGNKAIHVSDQIECAKKFKTMGSAKGVATRVWKKEFNHNLIGYEIKKVEVA